MQRLLTLILSLNLALHAVLGCCWHHAHAEPATPDANHHHCGHDHGPAPGHDDHDRAPAPDNCDEGACLFVRGDQSGPTVQMVELGLWLDLPESVAAAPIALTATRAVAAGDAPPPPELPQYLRFSALLI
jgi:hypothetical protein